MTHLPSGDLPVGEFLERLAARTPVPGGGGAAALTAAMAAALVAMAARFSASPAPPAAAPSSPGPSAAAPPSCRVTRPADRTEPVARQADEARRRLTELPDIDAAAYQAVLDAYALPKGAPGRRDRIRSALHAATLPPLEIAELAARIAGLADDVRRDGNPRLRGDAVTGAFLAAAAARSAAALVAINVTLGSLDPALRRRASQAATAAVIAASRAS